MPGSAATYMIMQLPTVERGNLALLLAPTSKQPETKLQETFFRRIDKVLESPQRTFPFRYKGAFELPLLLLPFDEKELVQRDVGVPGILSAPFSGEHYGLNLQKSLPRK